MITELVPNFLYSTMCSNSNAELYQDLVWVEEQLKNKYGKQEINPTYGSYTTQNYAQYNLFSFHTVSTNNLLKTFKDNLLPFLPEQNYVIQCWLNVFKRGSFIDWHTHWDSSAKAYHGYYCVNVGNSYTSYKIPPDIQYDVQNKNGLLVFGKSAGDQHKSSEWDDDAPRITVAFDLLPVIHNVQKTYNEHYIPF